MPPPSSSSGRSAPRPQNDRAIDSSVGAAKKPAIAVASSATAAGDVLRFRGCKQFRQRLVFATLAGRRLRIDGIRDKDAESPGMRDYEASFLRLIDKLTNGCRIEINDTGTSLRYTPGVIVGGAIEHDCGVGRAVGWFVEGVIPLLPFAKKPTTAAFSGITNDDADMTVDMLRTVTLPSLSHFGIGDGLSLTVKRRGAPPSGGGLAVLTCPVVRELTPVNLCDEGYVRRVRGVAYSAKVSPQLATRLSEGPRGMLLNLLPDVYVFTDHNKGAEAGLSPGYGITLTAQSTSGCFYGAQRSSGVALGLAESPLYSNSSNSSGSSNGPMTVLPEELGTSAASLLLDEIARGGCIDTATQPLFLTLMALTPSDASRVRIGQLGPAGVATLRLLKEVFGTTFKLKAESADPKALAAAAKADLDEKQRAAKERLAAKKAAKEAARGTKRGAEDDDEIGGSINKRKKRERDEAAAGDEDEGDVDGDEEITPQPPSAEVTTGRSARSILVSCLGLGMKNLYKKVT